MLLSGQVDSGAAANLETLRVLARNVGLERLPDRVLVLRLQSSMEELAKPDVAKEEAACHEAELSTAGELGNRLTLGRVAHMIADRCRSWPNTLATVVTPGEMCIFTSQKSRTPSHERMLLDEIGQALLRSARSQGLMMARIGISGLHPQPAGLLRAYHEAASALDAGHSTLNWFEALPERQQQPAQALGRVLKALQAAEPGAITAALREFLAAAAPAGASVAQLQQGRGLLTWACEHLTRELSALGASPEPMNSAKELAIQIIMGSPSSFAMAEAFRGFVDQLRLLIVQLFGHREQKIVSETQRLVREIGPEKATIQRLALDLKLSAGHLGRVYSRTTGHTLEEYLIRQKLEMSKRLLLDPRLHVAEVADRCGFCNPAYFASVFKKYMQCTPRAYASEPQRWGALETSAPEPEVQLVR
jgi:AraC-like DNA-binding protein